MSENQTTERIKCFNCGALISEMSRICPECGVNQNKGEALRLVDKMNSLLTEINDLPGWSDEGQAKQAELGSLILKTKLLYGDNEHIEALINELEERRKQTIKKKRILDVVRKAGPILLVFFLFFLGIYFCYLAFTLNPKPQEEESEDPIEEVEEQTAENETDREVTAKVASTAKKKSKENLNRSTDDLSETEEISNDLEAPEGGVKTDEEEEIERLLMEREDKGK